MNAAQENSTGAPPKTAPSGGGISRVTIMQNNVLNYLNKIVKEKPDKTAYSDGTLSLTFREVYQQSRSIGSFLHKKGVYKKPVVVFMRKPPDRKSVV